MYFIGKNETMSGRTIEMLRIQRGMTIRDLCNRSRISEKTYRRIRLNGVETVSKEALIAIANTLNVDINDILGC